MNKQNLNPWLYWFITTFAGYLGAHKFLDRQAGMGILYFFTCGLFGIGWFIDSIKAFILAIKGKPAAKITNESVNYTATNTMPKQSNTNFNVTTSFDDNNTIYSKIKGVTYPCINDSNYTRQNLISSLKPNEILNYNKYLHEGEPAIMLLNKNGLDLGFISKELANELYNEDDLKIQVAEITGGEDRTYGCNIVINTNTRNTTKQDINSSRIKTNFDNKKDTPKDSSEKTIITAKLTRVKSRCINDEDSSRQEYIALLEPGEELDYETDYNDNGEAQIIILDNTGHDIGTLSKSLSEKLEFEILDKITVLEITGDYDDYGCKVEIEY